MNIEPDVNVENTEIINKLIEELYCFVEELEQQVRVDLHGFQRGIETEDISLMEVNYSEHKTSC